MLNTNAYQAAVSYYLYIDVFSSDSKTRHFNRAVDRFVHSKVTFSYSGPSLNHKIYCGSEGCSSLDICLMIEVFDVKG